MIMKKLSLMIAIAVALCATACSGGTDSQKQPAPDTAVTDGTSIDTTINDVDLPDSPALGTDNIRMDSMNNSSR